jgi:DNA-binding protein HU-beta
LFDAWDPLKIEVFPYLALYMGFADPLSLTSKCGPGTRFRQFPRRKYIREKQKNKRSNMAAAKMTQSQMVKELAAAVGVPTKVAKSFTVAYAELAVRETKKSGVAVLPGIGRLVRVDRKARMGRNPATGEAIKIPAKKVVKFRVAKAVKDSIVPPKKK